MNKFQKRDRMAAEVYFNTLSAIAEELYYAVVNRFGFLVEDGTVNADSLDECEADLACAIAFRRGWKIMCRAILSADYAAHVERRFIAMAKRLCGDLKKIDRGILAIQARRKKFKKEKEQ